MLDLLLQLILELARALLVDELSERVRSKLSRQRGVRYLSRAIFNVHRRNRERLLNRLLTEIGNEL
jgi:hypothetical protein